ncbi:MAG: excinuclease ABC subunit UvrC [Clostridium sp.]|nr:excinuclease ABC subunit UvrC [Clostridium sp.]
MFDFEYQLSILPKNPGVYLMKDIEGTIIYVGKAKNLSNRVRSYFRKNKSHSQKTEIMVSKVSEFEYIITDNEMEALILEMNLIKKYRPRYNILLKDDKHFPFIKITTKEDFPRVYLTREYKKDGNKYFGPYTDVSAVHETLDTIKKIYPIRTCKRKIIEFGEKTKPCLNYHIGICKAPCYGLISKKEYGVMIEDIIRLLEGKDVLVKKELTRQMEEAAENLEFEKAANIRDKISSLDKTVVKQKVFTRSFEDEDYIALYKEGKDVSIQVFKIRDGKLLGRKSFVFDNLEEEKDEVIISEFIESYYSGVEFVPKRIYTEAQITDEVLIEWLHIRRGNKVSLVNPKIGDKFRMLNLAKSNAKLRLMQKSHKETRKKQINENALIELSELIEIEGLPNRIEAFDISNISGMDSVGTMVVYEDNKFKKSDYRRFKIKTIKGPDDYGSMREILYRRFRRGLKEIKEIQDSSLYYQDAKFSVFPDLIIMDGGKGQVNVCLEVLIDLNLEIPVIGLVKDDSHTTRGVIYENIEYSLDDMRDALLLLTKIQDEVHRFAINYHRSLRAKSSTKSILDNIPNIGEKRRRNLMIKFGSIKNIEKASFEKLLETPSINKLAAESIIEFFENKNKEKSDGN